MRQSATRRFEASLRRATTPMMPANEEIVDVSAESAEFHGQADCQDGVAHRLIVEGQDPDGAE